MNNGNVVVSVLCLTYNHEPFIREALEGFVNQETNFKYEVLIHDDSSTDGTADIIREYEEKYPEIIKPIYQSENQYSQGIRIIKTYLFPKAKGKYIALCEGDDKWINPNKLQKQVDFLEKNPDCVACIGGAILKDYSNNEKESFLFPTEKSRYVQMPEAIENGTNFPTSTFLYRRKMLETPNIFEDLNLSFGDYTAILRYLMAGKLYSFHEVFSLYRYKTNGSWTARASANLDGIIKFRDNLIKMYGVFNNYTSNKYKKFTDKKVLNYNYTILLQQGDIEALKKEPYKSLHKKGHKFKIKMKSFFSQKTPWLRIIYRNIRRILKGY